MLLCDELITQSSADIPTCPSCNTDGDVLSCILFWIGPLLLCLTSAAAHPIRKRENDLLCNHASNWPVLFLKWFVFEHGDFPLNSPLWNVLIWILFVKFMSCLHFSIYKNNFSSFFIFPAFWVIGATAMVSLFFLGYHLQYGPQYCSGHSND